MTINMKHVLLFLSVLMCSVAGSCQAKKDPNAEFVKQVTHLKEFTRSEKRIDSIAKKTGMPFKIGLVLIENDASEGNKENHPTDTSAAYINFDQQYTHVILFIVKYSKKSQKIISIEKNHLGTSLAEFGWKDD